MRRTYLLVKARDLRIMFKKLLDQFGWCPLCSPTAVGTIASQSRILKDGSVLTNLCARTSGIQDRPSDIQRSRLLMGQVRRDSPGPVARRWRRSFACCSRRCFRQRLRSGDLQRVGRASQCFSLLSNAANGRRRRSVGSDSVRGRRMSGLVQRTLVTHVAVIFSLIFDVHPLDAYASYYSM